MSRNLSALSGDFRVQVEELILACATKGIRMVPYCTLRDPYVQARLWRQSRTRKTIDSLVANWRSAGAMFLADVLESVGPQFGGHMTNTPPGYSWHQWGLAVDCFWDVDGEANWSAYATQTIDGQEANGYRVYAEEAERLGLFPGGLWPTLQDWPHVQAGRSPVSASHSLDSIDKEMANRFCWPNRS